ncbi:hypothetical protein BKA80DRAFT_269391 [Phyllosticta citrichinensis]
MYAILDGCLKAATCRAAVHGAQARKTSVEHSVTRREATSESTSGTRVHVDARRSPPSAQRDAGRTRRFA